MARIVFDLDGTLIDSVPDIHALANAVAAGHGLPEIDMPTTLSFVGRGASVFMDRFLAHHGRPQSDKPAFLAEFLAGYENAHDLTQVYPGVAEALQALRDQGHRLGLCTNKPMGPTRAVLKHLALDGYFDVVFAGDSLPVRKPDPAPLHAAFEALGDGQPAYVGDSETDAETAVAADVPFLLFTRGYRISAVDQIPHTESFDAWSDAVPVISNQLQN